MKDSNKNECKVLDIRKDILNSCYKAGVGHIASSFSVVEILFILYKYFLNNTQNDFILSKGHAAPALYAVLKLFNIISNDEYKNYCQFGSKLTSHPTSCIPSILFSSGALGLGLSVATGITMVNNLENKKRKTFVLMGDGELNEGSVWESLIYVGNKKISNIVVIIDRNNLQASGFTKNIIKIEPLICAVKKLGWSVHKTEGHILSNIKDTLDQIIKNKQPVILILETTKGKGVTFMENNPIWHHKIPNQVEYLLALRELNL